MDERGEPPSREDLAERLRAARTREDAEAGRLSRPRPGAGIGLGFRIAVELVAGVMVGFAIGYALDRWLGTGPWLMVVFLLLGSVAGLMNVYRAAKGLDESVGLGQAQRRQDRTEGD